MRKIKIEMYSNLLLRLDLFKDFKEEQFIQLFKNARYAINSYKKGQVIHLQNEVCSAMDIVLEGEVSVQKIDSSGNILKITVFSGADILGANLLFTSKHAYPMTIVSESRSVILHIYKELILELCHSNDRFMSGLMTEIADKSLMLTEKIDAISMKTIRQRIVEYLEYQYYLQKSYVIRLNITKKELAERLGIQRSSLSRELQKMRTDGLLEYDSRTITVKETGLIRNGDRFGGK
nr:Crp/Fnr family transcriptional regulator [uncultured Clostridium sp.]